MEFRPLGVDEAWEITLKPFHDPRGSFMRTYDRQIFSDHGLTVDWLQENQSENHRKGILRGFHFQAPPHAETKLVRAVAGTILDVFVDLRKGSPTEGRYEMVELSHGRNNMVCIPKGCAHAYLTISEHSIVAYKVDALYAPQAEGGIIWNDPTLKIPWPLEGPPLLSEKDGKWPTRQALASPF
jgi:dTDP-4-dehydrorhamnose 3,5-epimerase